MTGIMQYGIPTIFLVAGAAITSSKWFNDFVEDWDNIIAVLSVAFPIVGRGWRRHLHSAIRSGRCPP
ncbi:hypothetical protein J2Z22_000663 [Paenibacillus forsythiae]|uniref:Uncharacterized protein n=1 Tax=Paenibacillus forsythiae TaxID=365616 RepID=A0ABU3H335_9BACL|nr:hypothetical protein [Paenibacillus forsythiae]MDT3425150.1 hypothetical protein [Paenibacillus forsythiae]